MGTTDFLHNIQYHSFLKVFAVVGPIHLVGPRLVEVVVVVWGHDAQTLFLLTVGALYQLEEKSVGRKEVRSGSSFQSGCRKNMYSSLLPKLIMNHK